MISFDPMPMYMPSLCPTPYFLPSTVMLPAAPILMTPNSRLWQKYAARSSSPAVRAIGSTGTADFYITPNGEGVCAGEVTITYEDTNMVEKTATIQWSTNVVNPMAGMDMPGGMGEFDPGMMEDPTLADEKKSPAPFIIGGVVVAGGVAAFLIRRRILKKRSEEADANL